MFKFRTNFNGSFCQTALNKPAVISRFFGVYSPEDDLLKVCKTKKRAMYERAVYESQHGEGFYVDRVWLYP